MMRLSFLLLLMTAVSCCEPNSPTEPKECPKLGNITQSQFTLAVSLDAHSLPNVVNNSAECSKDTPILFFRQSSGFIVTASTIKCKDGNWLVEKPNGGKNSFNTTEVCCRGYKRECAEVDEITQDRVDAELPGYDNERSSPNVTDGRLVCSKATDKMYFMNELHIEVAFQIVCTGAEWFVESETSYEVLEKIKVSCIHSVKKPPTTPQPGKENECERFDDIKQSEFDEVLPGFVVAKANVTNNTAFCSDPTKQLYFRADEGVKFMRAESITCEKHVENGEWFWATESDLGTRYFYTPDVCCARRTSL